MADIALPPPVLVEDPRPHAVMLDKRYMKKLARLPSYVQADYATLIAVTLRGIEYLSENVRQGISVADAKEALDDALFVKSWIDETLDMSNTHDRGALARDMVNILVSEQALKERRGDIAEGDDHVWQSASE